MVKQLETKYNLRSDPNNNYPSKPMLTTLLHRACCITPSLHQLNRNHNAVPVVEIMMITIHSYQLCTMKLHRRFILPLPSILL